MKQFPIGKGEVYIRKPCLCFHTQFKTIKRRLPRFQITHVRRELNKRADELANLAIKQHRDASVM